MPALSILVWLPLACGLLGALASVRSQRAPGVVALLGTIAALGLSIGYIADYKPGGGLQHVTDVVWIAELGIHYKLAITGLNVFLVGLTTLLFAAAVLASNLRGGEGGTQSFDRPRLYYFNFMLAESAVLGAFLAQDLALFVAFFDLMLIPFYFLIGGWGQGPDRVKATIKLVIYTLVGSLLMLAAAIATGVLTAEQTGHHITFVLSELHSANLLGLSTGSQEWIFLFFAAAFLVKMPAFPLHGWMPDGYRAMPIEVLMVFSGVLSKVGAYGFLAIVLPLFPRAAVHFQTLMLLIALASIIYGSIQAFSQTDARLILGYSSVAQLGFITLGIFALNPQGAQGALLQMVNHGLVMGPILFIVALLAQRTGGSEDIREMGGIAFRAPVLASLLLIVTLATLAIPGSSNFVGEFLILLGIFRAKLAIAIIAFSGVVLASVYALRLLIRAMHNRVGDRVQSREMTLRDGAVLVPLVAVILFFAVYPQLALHRSEGSVKGAVEPAQALAHFDQLAALSSCPSAEVLRLEGMRCSRQEHRSGNSYSGVVSVYGSGE
jgi:NADH-quinone oxidoreductase subunit M